MDDREQKRLDSMQSYERSLREKGYIKIAGVDEAGRGPLAGPVFAAACILPSSFFLEGIDDSKKLTSAKRKKLYDRMVNSSVVIYSIAMVSPQIIDRINILQATLLAMKKAVEQLSVLPDYVLVDGNQKPNIDVLSAAIIKGDSLSISIAAASILAKHARDEWMKKIHQKWPEYGFDKHMGYGTKKHLDIIERIGPCPEHRYSFAPIKTGYKR